MRLRKKIALITGGNSGIGKAIAYELANEGAQVIINYLDNRKEAEEIVSQLKDLRYNNQKSLCVCADVSSTTALRQMIDSIKEKVGNIDILVNNAGIQTEKPFVKLTEDEVNRIWAVNLKGTFFCSQFIARQMIDNCIKGKIINISSIHQTIPRHNIAHYAASKGAIRMLTKSLALELASYNINVNSIAPGAIKTPMNRVVLSNNDLIGKISKKIPMHRFGNAQEVAKVASFLASDDADYVTGATYYIDGGLSLGNL